jgi:hypothetical protein
VDERLRVVGDDAVRAIDRQATRLNELRARAGTFITAGAVLASFLGAPAVKGDRSLATIGGTAAFLIVLAAAAHVLAPRDGWRFARPGHLGLEAFDRDELAESDDLGRAYAKDLGDDYAENEKMLEPLAKALVVAVGALALEAVTLLYAAAA